MSYMQNNNTNPFSNSKNPFLTPYAGNLSVRCDQSTAVESDTLLSAEAFIDKCYEQFVSNEVIPIDNADNVLQSTVAAAGQVNSTPRSRPVPKPRRTQPLHSVNNSSNVYQWPHVSPTWESTHVNFAHGSEPVVSPQVNEGPELMRNLVRQFTEAIKETRASNLHSVDSHPQPKWRLPWFDGQGDIHLFKHQFEQISSFSGWDEQISLIQLRSCLEGSAKDCGRGSSVNEVFSRLISMFGCSPFQAREQLHSLHYQPTESYTTLSNRVERLVRIAYGDLGEKVVNQMALEHFTRALEDTSLRCHMLAVKPRNLAEATEAAEQFAMAKRSFVKNSKVQRLNKVDVTLSKSEYGELKNIIHTLQSTVEDQSRLINDQRRRLDSLERSVRSPLPTPRFTGTVNKTCFECGDPSHLRNRCPLLKRVHNVHGNSTVSPSAKSEN